MAEDLICRIIAGELDAAVVHRDQEMIAFLDHRPVFKGHVLISPLRHVHSLLELPENLMAPLLGLGRRLTLAMIAELGCQGSFTALNTVVSQSVPHLHLHVVPRTKGDGLRGFFWPRTKYAAGEAEEYAHRLAAALATVPADGSAG